MNILYVRERCGKLCLGFGVFGMKVGRYEVFGSIKIIWFSRGFFCLESFIF